MQAWLLEPEVLAARPPAPAAVAGRSGACSRAALARASLVRCGRSAAAGAVPGGWHERGLPAQVERACFSALAEKHLALPPPADLPRNSSASLAPERAAALFDDLTACLRIDDALRAAVAARGLASACATEMAFVPVLAQLESRGIGFSPARVLGHRTEMEQTLISLEQARPLRTQHHLFRGLAKPCSAVIGAVMRSMLTTSYLSSCRPDRSFCVARRRNGCSATQSC